MSCIRVMLFAAVSMLGSVTIPVTDAIGSQTAVQRVASTDEVIMRCKKAGKGPTYATLTCVCTAQNGFAVQIIAEGAYCPYTIRYNYQTNSWRQ